MSLKGYQWLNDKGEVVMSYRFKDLKIDIWQDTTKEELDKFIDFLEKQHCKHNKMDLHFNKVKGYLELD